MNITIHRGQQQIGGSIIEIATENTKLIFDIGINLDEGDDVAVPKIDGLFCGSNRYDAVFLSHYHSDHIGLLDYLLPDIPVYMGEASYRMVCAAREYRHIPCHFNQPQFVTDREPITVGDMRITPYRCDHSAYDSYMYVIEGDGKRVLYTGDFRANGRADFYMLLEELPIVDVLLTEGTTLSREDEQTNIEESLLEDIAVRELSKHNGPAFVLMSAMNIDRLITAYRIAERTGRVLLEDLYTASVACAAGEDIPQPNGAYSARVFMTSGGDEQHQQLEMYDKAKIGKYGIAKTPFVMCVRSSMLSYLNRLNEVCSFEDGVLFYGMWKGYLEQPQMKEFVEFLQSKGVKYHTLHTSGHADATTIDALVKQTVPKQIVPIHTESAEWFDRYTKCEIVHRCYHHEV